MRVRFAPLPPKTKFALGTTLVLEDIPERDRRSGLVSTSPTVNAIGAVAVSSLITWFAMLEMVGGLFTELTTVAELLAGLESPLLPLMLARLVNVPGMVTVTTMVMVALAPELRLPRLQVTTLLFKVLVPWLVFTETKLTSFGNVSKTITLL